MAIVVLATPAATKKKMAVSVNRMNYTKYSSIFSLKLFHTMKRIIAVIRNRKFGIPSVAKKTRIVGKSIFFII